MTGEERVERPNGEEEESLRDVLSAIADFLREIKEPVRELIDVFLQALDGDRIGRDVAAFYKRLVEAGVPQETAEKLTMEYFRARVESVSRIPRLMGRFSKPPAPWGGGEEAPGEGSG